MIGTRPRPLPPLHLPAAEIAWAPYRQRRDERARLREQDRRSERLAALRAVADVLAGARRHVVAGWVQHRWFAPLPAGLVAGPAADLATDPGSWADPRPSASGSVLSGRVSAGSVSLGSVSSGPAVTSERVGGGCLVGSLVLAGGGVRAASGQPVQRAIAMTWHTLFRPAEPEVDWCAPAAVRLARARDLVRWNDLPSRAGDDVVALLDRAHAGVLDHLATERAAAGVQPLAAGSRP